MLISHTINNFLNDSSQDDNLIPNFLFEERKKVFIKLPFFGKNEKLSKTFIEKLNSTIQVSLFKYSVKFFLSYGKVSMVFYFSTWEGTLCT